MSIALVFVMGVANFALHRAVLSTRHPMLAETALMRSKIGGRLTLAIEFVVLIAALGFAYGGSAWAIFAYGGYTIANALAAWLILSRRI